MRDLKRALERSVKVRTKRGSRVIAAPRTDEMVNSVTYPDLEYWLYARSYRRFEILRHMQDMSPSPKLDAIIAELTKSWDALAELHSKNDPRVAARKAREPFMRIEVTV